MRLEFHPAVQKDFNDALDYYEREAGMNIANRFEVEFRAAIMAIKAGPTRFPYYQQSPLFRRVRLKTFPTSSSIGKSPTSFVSPCSSTNAATRSTGYNAGSPA